MRDASHRRVTPRYFRFNPSVRRRSRIVVSVKFPNLGNTLRQFKRADASVRRLIIETVKRRRGD